MQNIVTLFTHDRLNPNSRSNFMDQVERILNEDLRDAMQDISEAYCRCICPEARRRGVVTMPIENRTSARLVGHEATAQWVRAAFNRCGPEKIRVSICVDKSIWQFDWENNQGMIRCGESESSQVGCFKEAPTMNLGNYPKIAQDFHPQSSSLRNSGRL